MDKDLKEQLEISDGKAAGGVAPPVLGEVPAADPEEAKRKQRDLGIRNMLFGALWCIGGIVVTAVTYDAAASSPGGGKYIVAWGAILFGGIQCLKGFFQFLTA